MGSFPFIKVFDLEEGEPKLSHDGSIASRGTPPSSWARALPMKISELKMKPKAAHGPSQKGHKPHQCSFLVMKVGGLHDPMITLNALMGKHQKVRQAPRNPAPSTWPCAFQVSTAMCMYNQPVQSSCSRRQCFVVKQN